MAEQPTSEPKNSLLSGLFNIFEELKKKSESLSPGGVPNVTIDSVVTGAVVSLKPAETPAYGTPAMDIDTQPALATMPSVAELEVAQQSFAVHGDPNAGKYPLNIEPAVYVPSQPLTPEQQQLVQDVYIPVAPNPNAAPSVPMFEPAVVKNGVTMPANPSDLFNTAQPQPGSFGFSTKAQFHTTPNQQEGVIEEVMGIPIPGLGSPPATDGLDGPAAGGKPPAGLPVGVSFQTHGGDGSIANTEPQQPVRMQSRMEQLAQQFGKDFKDAGESMKASGVTSSQVATTSVEAPAAVSGRNPKLETMVR